MDEGHVPTQSKQPASVLPILLIGGMAAGVLMAAAVMLYGSQGISSNRLPTPIPDVVVEGKPAPEFSGELIDGSTIKLSDFRGSVVAVNFWATWCGPCKVEMPLLEEANKSGQFVVLAVNAGETAKDVQKYMSDLDLTFPSVLDTKGEIVDLYSVRVFPTTVFIDADGIIIAEHFGPLTKDLLDQYLGE